MFTDKNKDFLFNEELKQVLFHPLILSMIIGSIFLNYFIVKGIYIGPNSPRESDFNKVISEYNKVENYWDQKATELNNDDLAWLYFMTDTDNIEDLNNTLRYSEDEMLVDQIKLLSMRQAAQNDYDYGYRMLNAYANNAKNQAIGGMIYEKYLDPLFDFKYNLFEKRCTEVLEKSSINDLMYPELIFQYHEYLYWDTLKMALLEMMLITMVITILAKNNIYSNHVEPFMITSVSGRTHFKMKQRVAVISQLIAGVLILFFTTVFFIMRFDYFKFSFSNISSVFNIIPGIPTWPFVTWIDFNVLGYFIATLVFMLIITTWYSLFVSSICNVFHKTLPLLMGVLLITALGLYLPYAIGTGNWLMFVVIGQPIFMVMLIGAWFTGAVSMIYLPMLETVVLIVWSIVLYFIVKKTLNYFLTVDHQEEWT